MRLLIVLLSQPLFHAPDEYLVILNPFSTYLTNRRCKNVKNLFVSLVNIIISYDCAGYVSSSKIPEVPCFADSNFRYRESLI